MAKATLYKRVALLRDRFSPALQKYPLDIKTLMPNLIPVSVGQHNFDNPKLCGIAYVGKREDTVLLNSNRTPVQQNFDAAHEFIHLTLHRDIHPINFGCLDTVNTSAKSSVMEWQANEGAAELLVPYSIFLPMVKDEMPSINHLYGSMHAYKVKLAGYFNVPISTITYRFKSLEYELQQYDIGVPLGDIKFLSRRQQTAKNIYISSLSSCGNLRQKSKLVIEA